MINSCTRRLIGLPTVNLMESDESCPAPRNCTPLEVRESMDSEYGVHTSESEFMWQFQTKLVQTIVTIAVVGAPHCISVLMQLEATIIIV